MRGYLICTSPRTGSTALCAALTSSGVLGKPIEDFNRALAEKPAEEDNRFATYLRNGVMQRGVKTGVLATKLFWHQLDNTLHHRVPRLSQRTGFEMLMRCTNPAPLIVRLERRDKVRQAVSYVRAARSDVWHVSEGMDNPSHLDASDYAAVDRRVADFERWEAAWDGLLEILDVTPVRLWYEDIVDDWTGAVALIAERLEIALPADLPSRIKIRTTRQSDSATEDFLEAYHLWKAASEPAAAETS